MKRDFWRCHILVFCCAANQYTEVVGIFQTEEHVLRVNKSKIMRENIFDGDNFYILIFKVTMDQVKIEKLCFGCFCRFVTSALTLRLRSTYIYVFQALFGFFNF